MIEPPSVTRRLYYAVGTNMELQFIIGFIVYKIVYYYSELTHMGVSIHNRRITMSNIEVITAIDATTALKNTTTVLTHSGVFHADEILAVAIIYMSTPRPVRVIRTRDRELISAMVADSGIYVLDLGGADNVIDLNFDHHQKEGVRTYRDGTMYATAGMLWRHLGGDILQRLADDPEIYMSAFRHVELLLKEVDNFDNGETEKHPSLSETISSFNPPWGSESTSDSRFVEAVDFAVRQLQLMIELAISHAEAATRVHAAYEARTGGVIVLEQFVPWKTHVMELDIDKEVMYCVYPDGKEWRVYAMPVALDRFGDRLPLPKEWRGLEGESLQQVAGVNDATFCHRGGFIGGALTREGAISMAGKAVALQQQPMGRE